MMLKGPVHVDSVPLAIFDKDEREKNVLDAGQYINLLIPFDKRSACSCLAYALVSGKYVIASKEDVKRVGTAGLFMCYEILLC